MNGAIKELLRTQVQKQGGNLITINILSLVQAFSSLGQESYTNYLQHYGVEIRDREAEDLKILTKSLYNLKGDKSIFDRFYVGYKIPQIGKEFDLLRFGTESVINIELKKTSTEDKILKQLVRNKYYLSYIQQHVYNLSFVSDTKQMYFLNHHEKLEKVDVTFLEKLLINQECKYIHSIDDLFDPSDYLVSPFNSTHKFINDKYFLTHQQEDIKDKIVKSFDAAKSPNFISVVGGAGTGKTLLIYDIAKHLLQAKKRALIIHCGYLNSGQEELKRHGWEIIPIKHYSSYKLSAYDAIFIDEAQRIYPNQLRRIIEQINSIGGNCVFSYDKAQTLSRTEEKRNIDAIICGVHSIVNYKLSEKIRTNKEIASFIKMLFNKKRSLPLTSSVNIELNYFDNIEDAKHYLSSLNSDDWEILRFTPSQFNKEHHQQYSETSKKTSHEVIGQEFDGVAVTIDHYFSYGDSDELGYKSGTYYHSAKMLFQNLTRARKRLNLVIIANKELLDRCVYILKTPADM